MGKESEKKDFKKNLKESFNDLLDNKTLAETKTEDGEHFPKSAFLFTPDSESPSTWKLRTWETPTSKITIAQLGRAAAALSSGGFRGNRVQVPSGEVKSIKNKLISLYEGQGVSKEQIPKHLFLEEEGGDNFTMEDTAKIKKLEETVSKFQESEKFFQTQLKELKDSQKKEIETFQKSLEDTFKTQTENRKKELDVTSKRLEEAEKRLAQKDVELHEEKVENQIRSLEEAGHYPAVLERAKKILLQDIGGNFTTIQLEEGKDKPKVSLSEAVVAMLKAIPKEARLVFEELTKTKINSSGSKFMSESEVEKWAKDNNMSYSDACSALTRKGLIEI